MIRVCHIISGDLWAGAEVMACHLLKQLASRSDVELFVLLLNEGSLAEELRSAQICTQVIDESSHSFLKLTQMVRSILKQNSPDIIHSHRYKENLLAFLASCFFKETRLITTQHGLPEVEKMSLPWRVKSIVNRYIMSHYFDIMIAVSRDIKNFFVNEHRFAPSRISVIKNGINVNLNSSSRKSSEHFVIGSSGRLFPVKGYPLLVDVSRLITQKCEISIALAGDGPGMGELISSVQQYNLSNLQLEGHIDDMNTFYDGLSVYINTSHHEGIPMTILEAMAHGLPIIAPKVGGIPEIIDDGVEGFLIDGRNPQDFADKCLMLYNDKDLWQRMSVAAREKVCKEFSRERMADRYLECYQELLT